MNDLQFQATRAVAEADPHGPNGKLPAIHILRVMTDKRHTLREYIDAVDWAMARPRLTMTRDDKKRAVKEMAARLSGVSENFAHAQTHPGDFRAGAAAYFNRRQGTLRAALLRIAMARTAD